MGVIIVCDGVVLLPFNLEGFQLLAVGLASMLLLIVFPDFGNCLELLDDLLVVTPALGSSSVLEVFFEGFEYLGGSE